MFCDNIPSEVLKTIKPQYVRMYLCSRGWSKNKSTLTYDVFRNEDYNEELVVPNDSIYRDYQYRLQDIVDLLSSLENTSPSNIITGMMISNATDIIEYRYEPQNNESGIIPISRLMSILQTNKNLTSIAYRDMKEWKPAYFSSKWKGSNIVDEVRVGPTVPGSYIVKFIYPAIEKSKSIQSDISGAPSFSNEDIKLVCNKLEGSLRVVVECAENSLNMIEEDEKISYNFVSALLDLKFEDASVDIRRTEIIGKKDDISKPISLTYRLFDRISRIEENMRPKEMDVDRTFTGYIINMKDDRKSVEETNPGTLRLKFVDSGDSKSAMTATLSLSGDDLDLAYLAMSKRSPVTMKGKLIGNRSKHIEEIYDFKINE